MLGDIQPTAPRVTSTLPNCHNPPYCEQGLWEMIKDFGSAVVNGVGCVTSLGFSVSCDRARRAPAACGQLSQY